MRPQQLLGPLLEGPLQIDDASAIAQRLLSDDGPRIRAGAAADPIIERMMAAARAYTRAGRRAHESSQLLKLIRYRTVEGGGFTLLRPAIPGPGWPMRRTPSSMSPEIGSGPRKTLSIAAVERRRPGS